MEYRYAPMIIEGGAVKIMVYDQTDALCSVLEIRRTETSYVVTGMDPHRGKSIRTKVEGISAFDAARKYCEGSLL
jgi:hypothetical protein